MSTVKNGIVQIITKRVSWPPNLPKFLELASGIDTDAAFERMISRKPPLDDVEKMTRDECAFACRTQLSADKARALFAKVYAKWHERSLKGEMPDQSVKALPQNSATKPTDHMVEERIRSGKKTPLEIRLEAIRIKK